MKITLLCENAVGYAGADVCLAEWGFSAFIQAREINILFDAGLTDVYKRNAEKLLIPLDKTDFVILSHHHDDHTGGLRFHAFKDIKKLIAHPEVFGKLPQNEYEKIKKDFEIISSKQPLEFVEGMYFLGEVPRENDFEDKDIGDETVVDDSAIAIKTSKGAVLITGCSHSGICNICEYAKQITGQPLYAVIGGFHLFEDNPEIVDKTIQYFKAEKPEYILPMHCVDFPTQAKLYANCDTEKYSTGDTIELGSDD